MGRRGWTSLIVLVVLFSFSVYAYKIRTSYNIDKEKLHAAEHHQQMEVLKYAISLVPKEVKNEVYFNAVETKYPGFKKNENICGLLGYKLPVKEKETEKTESFIKEDTTVKDVMNNIMD